MLLKQRRPDFVFLCRIKIGDRDIFQPNLSNADWPRSVIHDFFALIGCFL